MIDGQRRRTLTGHWLTTRVLEEVGRVFSALRCTHRGRGTKKPSLSPFGSGTISVRQERSMAEQRKMKESTPRRGEEEHSNSKVQVTQKPCVSTKYTLPKRPSATLRSESESQPRSTGSRVPHSLAGSQHSGRIRHDFRGVCVSGLWPRPARLPTLVVEVCMPVVRHRSLPACRLASERGRGRADGAQRRLERLDVGRDRVVLHGPRRNPIGQMEHCLA